MHAAGNRLDSDLDHHVADDFPDTSRHKSPLPTADER